MPICDGGSIIRVLVLDQGPGLWGAQRYLLRLSPLLAARGVELTLACPRQLEQFDHWRSIGAPVIPLDLPTSRTIRRGTTISAALAFTEMRRSVRTPRLIAAAARAGGFHMIMANAHWTHLDAAIAGRLARLPTVLTLHETPMPGVGRRMRDTAITTAGHAVAVSDSVAAASGKRARSRIAVIPNGVDTDVFSPAAEHARATIRRRLGIPEQARVLLACTRIDPTKRIEDLVTLSRHLPPGAVLLIAGTTSAHPEYAADISNSVARLPRDRIRLLGERSDIPDLLRMADLYVHSGLVEGMPLGLVEAAATGLPAVAYEAAGVRDVVVDHRSGIVVAPGDVDALTAAVNLLLANASMRRDFGHTARAHATRHHRLPDQADRNADLFRAICTGGP